MDFVHAHPFALLLSWWIFSAATGSLPAPTVKSSPAYQFIFKFMNTIAANVARAYNTQVENSPNFSAAAETRAANVQNAADAKTLNDILAGPK